MAKGSQLSQLKSALSKAGFTGKPQQGRKRKRSESMEKDKEAKATRLHEINRRLNPFDLKVTKVKHDVLGRKIKGVVGKPARSKQTGIEQRKKTLLKEVEDRDRAGGIIDRRFGENDPTMSPEERMLERFTRERQRSSKGLAFNLEDEDELTHLGQSLSKLDDFDDAGLTFESEGDDEGQVDKEIVDATHFGGFGDDDDREDEEQHEKKSRAEVMAEVIAKSKEHKMIRQIEREHGENIRYQLDQDFGVLRDLLYAPNTSGIGNKSNLDPFHRPDVTPQPPIAQPGDYDQHVRELAFEKRAKPKDRTKTEEELALEEKAALEGAERRRQKRMLGLEDSDSEDEEHYRKKRRRGGDDLEDDFVDVDAWGGLGEGLGLESDVVDQEDKVSMNPDSSRSASRDASASVVETGMDEVFLSAPSSASIKEKGKAGADPGLPFTFPCPSTHEEFLSIIQDVNDADIPTVVKRIRVLHHTSLEPENKYKLQAFANVLIDHILYVVTLLEPRFGLVSSLLPHLGALIIAYPAQCAAHFIKKLSLMQKDLRHGLATGPLDLTAKTWPSLANLTLFRIIGSTWSTSDLNHPVVSPARILLGSYLGLCRIRALADLTSGLFVCTLLLQYEAHSKRFVPEAVNFLVNTFLHLAPHPYKTATSLPGSFASPDFKSELCESLAIQGKVTTSAVSPKANLVALLSGDRPVVDEDKLDLLAVTLELLWKFGDMYKNLEGFVELYSPILEIINNTTAHMLPDVLESRLRFLKDNLDRLLRFARQARQPLYLQAHKPIPIPSYIPKFETFSSSYLRRQDPDQERNEAAKLRRQYRQEKKGVIREFRKDARFLAAVEQGKQKGKDSAYHEHMRRVFGSIEGERAEEKAMEREKAKVKRRAGRK